MEMWNEPSAFYSSADLYTHPAEGRRLSWPR